MLFRSHSSSYCTLTKVPRRFILPVRPHILPLRVDIRPLPSLGLPQCLLGYPQVFTISSCYFLVGVVRLPIVGFIVVSRSPVCRLAFKSAVTLLCRTGFLAEMRALSLGHVML